MSMLVSPIEMSECPASSNNVECGLAGSNGTSRVAVAHSAAVSPAKTSSTRPSSASRMPAMSW